MARLDTGNLVSRERARLMGEAVGPLRPRPTVKAELRRISKAMIASLPLDQRGAEEVDWALVPGLAFDEQGFRLGRGGGYYDRLLPQLRPDATCWAICLSCQLMHALPVEPHDAPLNGIATPDRVVRGLRGSWSACAGPSI